MSLITYKDVRPWPKTIKARTLIRDKQGVMPPWFVEKDFGIQQFKNDPSLRDMDLAKIAKRADSISAAVQAEFQTWMKSLQTQVTAVRGGIVAKNNATVSAEAGKLAEVFERVNAFWQKQHNDDALQFSDWTVVPGEADERVGRHSLLVSGLTPGPSNSQNPARWC